MLVNIAACLPINTGNPEAKIKAQYIELYYGSTQYLAPETQRMFATKGCPATAKALVDESTGRIIPVGMTQGDAINSGIRTSDDAKFELAQLIAFHGLKMPISTSPYRTYNPRDYTDISIVARLTTDADMVSFRPEVQAPRLEIYKAYVAPYWGFREGTRNYNECIEGMIAGRCLSYDTSRGNNISLSHALQFAQRQPVSAYSCTNTN